MSGAGIVIGQGLRFASVDPAGRAVIIKITREQGQQITELGRVDYFQRVDSQGETLGKAMAVMTVEQCNKLHDRIHELEARLAGNPPKPIDLPTAEPFIGTWTNEDPVEVLQIPKPSNIPLRLSPESILEEADRLVHGDRRGDYGTALVNHGKTARLWNEYLGDRLRTKITARDVCWLNILQKASRDTFKPKRDNEVDTAGYAANMEMIRDEEASRAAIAPNQLDQGEWSQLKPTETP